MKTFKISKKLLPVMLLPLANAASATTAQFSVGFTTLSEITIGLIRGMKFVHVLKLPDLSACILTASATKTLGDLKKVQVVK